MSRKINRAQVAMNERQFREMAKKAAAWEWRTGDQFDLKLTEWDDPDYPDGALIECGHLVRVHFRAPSGPQKRGRSARHPRRKRDTTVTFSPSVVKEAQLAFDPNHPSDRLYMLLPERACTALATRFWQDNPAPPRLLSEWAMLAGGRHAKGGYPDVVAKPVGVMTAVVYFKNKEGDGTSYYLHKMGEVSCYYPILACDERGRLWVCGGNYTSPAPGITD